MTGTNQLSLTARGLFGTKAVDHDKGTSIQTYEASGMPLTGINTTHTIPTDPTLFDAMNIDNYYFCLLYTSPSPRDRQKSRMPSSA